jgi:hypothetical protein
MLPHSKRRHASRLCASPRVCIRSVVLMLHVSAGADWRAVQ